MYNLYGEEGTAYKIDNNNNKIIRMNQFEFAFKSFDQALNIEPEHMLSLYGKAQCAFALGQFEKAHSFLVIADQIKPNQPQILELLKQCGDSLNA